MRSDPESSGSDAEGGSEEALGDCRCSSSGYHVVATRLWTPNVKEHRRWPANN